MVSVLYERTFSFIASFLRALATSFPADAPRKAKGKMGEVGGWCGGKGRRRGFQRRRSSTRGVWMGGEAGYGPVRGYVYRGEELLGGWVGWMRGCV